MRRLLFNACASLLMLALGGSLIWYGVITKMDNEISGDYCLAATGEDSVSRGLLLLWKPVVGLEGLFGTPKRR